MGRTEVEEGRLRQDDVPEPSPTSEVESGAHAGKEGIGLNPGLGFCWAQLHLPKQCNF